MSHWTVAYKNRLPDSAFLLIESGGHLDATGRTVPRTLRHFPVRDIEDRFNVRHAKNALSRIPQSKIAGLTRDRQRALQAHVRAMLQAHKRRPGISKVRDVLHAIRGAA